MNPKTILKSGTATVAEIDAQIEAIKQEVAALENQQEGIKQAIADQWGDDTSNLEAQYGQMSVKLQAAGMVIEKLSREREKVQMREQKREIIAKAAANMHERQQLNQEDEKTRVKIERLKAELAAATERRHEIGNLTITSNMHEQNYLHEMELLGIPREQAYQMFKEAYQAQAKQNDKKK